MNKINTMKSYKIRYVFNVFILLLFFLSRYSLAENPCSPYAGWNNETRYFDLPTELVVQKNIPVGGVLYETSLTITNSRVEIGKCSIAGSFILDTGYNMLFGESGIPGVINTNISGIGIKLEGSNFRGWSSPLNAPFPAIGDFRLSGASGVYFEGGETIKVSLIKTKKEVGNGQLKLGGYGYMSLGVIGDAYLVLTFSNRIPTKVIGSTCEITGNNNFSLNFRPILAKKNLPLNKEIARKEMVISLNCNSGARVSFTIEGDRGRDLNYIKNQATDNPAKGVEFGLAAKTSSGNKFLTIGEPLVITESAKSSENINIIASLYRVDNMVIPGKVYSIVTYTFSYE